METLTTDAQMAALVRALVMGAKARTHNEMVGAMQLAAALRKGLTEAQIEQCKLKAERQLEGR